MTGLLHEKEFSRKNFVKGGGALIIGVSALAGVANARADQTKPPAADHPSAGAFNQRTSANYLPDVTQVDTWITINADNTCTVTHGETELGHGTPTGILMLTAEELNMNFSQMWYAHPESWLNVTGGGSGSSGISSPVDQHPCGGGSCQGDAAEHGVGEDRCACGEPVGVRWCDHGRRRERHLRPADRRQALQAAVHGGQRRHDQHAGPGQLQAGLAVHGRRQVLPADRHP